jgi:hypothetical protein
MPMVLTSMPDKAESSKNPKTNANDTLLEMVIVNKSLTAAMIIAAGKTVRINKVLISIIEPLPVSCDMGPLLVAETMH